MLAAEWREGGNFFRFRGEDVFYRCEGEGPSLLLIHGFPTSSYDFYQLWKPLTQDFRVLTCDMLGFGFSAKPKRKYSIKLQAELCAELVDRNRTGDEVFILAHDYGDSVAQELLAANRGHRFQITACTFLNGGLFPDKHQTMVMQRVLASPLGSLLVRWYNFEKYADVMRKISGENPPSDQDLRTQWELMEHNSGLEVLPKISRYLAERKENEKRWTNILVSTSARLQLICGARDPISGRTMIDAWAKRVPEGRLAVLREVGHYPQLEAPGHVLREFARFHQLEEKLAPKVSS